MVAGKKFSPIVTAIAQAEEGTSAEIRVHLSRKWFERDPLLRARRIFEGFEMHKTRGRNAVLIYVNLKRRKFAIFGDLAVHETVGQQYWEEAARHLAKNLQGTHPERAIALCVLEVGKVLKTHFPAGPDDNDDELPNEVSEDRF